MKKSKGEPIQQPKLCKGCIWGQWEGTKQFCSKQVCVKKGMKPSKE